MSCTLRSWSTHMVNGSSTFRQHINLPRPDSMPLGTPMSSVGRVVAPVRALETKTLVVAPHLPVVLAKCMEHDGLGGCVHTHRKRLCAHQQLDDALQGAEWRGMACVGAGLLSRWISGKQLDDALPRGE